MIYYFAITVTDEVTMAYPEGYAKPVYMALHFAAVYDTGQYNPCFASVKRSCEKALKQKLNGWKDRKHHKVTYMQLERLTENWFELIYPDQLDKFESTGRLGLNLYEE